MTERDGGRDAERKRERERERERVSAGMRWMEGKRNRHKER